MQQFTLQPVKELIRLSDHVVSQEMPMLCIYLSVIRMINDLVKADYQTCANQQRKKTAVKLRKKLYNAAPSAKHYFGVTLRQRVLKRFETKMRVLLTTPMQSQRNLLTKRPVHTTTAHNTGREALRRSKAIKSASHPSLTQFAKLTRFGTQPCFRRRGNV